MADQRSAKRDGLDGTIRPLNFCSVVTEPVIPAKSCDRLNDARKRSAAIFCNGHI